LKCRSHRPERLQLLAQMALDWHWEDRGTELIRKAKAAALAKRPER
jgi:hypothetical protein